MIPYILDPNSLIYTLSQSKLLENGGTYLYSPYTAVPPPPRALALPRSPAALDHFFGNIVIKGSESELERVLFIIPSLAYLQLSRFSLVY